MTKLIVQADDAAITHAATLGILASIDDGIVRNTGIFANRPDAAFAAAELKRRERVDVGIDLNLVTGSPLLPAAEVPDLVDEHGAFRSSRQIRREYEVVRRDGFFVEFDRDPFDHDQVLAETRAQLQRFLELMGRPPAYVHHHSLITQVLHDVLHEITDEFGLHPIDLHRGLVAPLLDIPWYTTPFGPAEQAAADPVAAFETILPEILAHDLSILVVHPGYVDAELLDITTYNVIRARDLEFVTDTSVRALLENAGVELTTYSAVRAGR